MSVYIVVGRNAHHGSCDERVPAHRLSSQENGVKDPRHSLQGSDEGILPASDSGLG